MTNLELYSKKLDELYVLYKRQRERLNAYNSVLYTFSDEKKSKIKMSTTQKKKALELARKDVLTLEILVSDLKNALDIEEEL